MTADGLFFYFVAFMTMGGIYAILCLALNMQWGFGGLFNAGIAGFYAVGAYTAAIVTSARSSSHLGGFDLPIVLGLLVAGLLSGTCRLDHCAHLRAIESRLSSHGIDRHCRNHPTSRCERGMVDQWQPRNRRNSATA